MKILKVFCLHKHGNIPLEKLDFNMGANNFNFQHYFHAKKTKQVGARIRLKTYLLGWEMKEWNPKISHRAVRPPYNFLKV